MGTGLGYMIDIPVWIGESPGAGRTVRDTVIREDLECGLSVRITRDGIVIFGFESWDPGLVTDSEAPTQLLNRMRVLNTHVATLQARWKRETQYRNPLQIVTIENVITAHTVDWDGWGLSNTVLSDRIRDPTLSRSDTISLEAAHAALADLDKLFRSAAWDEHSEWLVLHLRASKADQDLDAHAALLDSWGAIEAICRRRWVERSSAIPDPIRGFDAFTGMTRDQRRDLESVDPPPRIANIVEALRRLDAMTPHVASRIEVAREARNAWLHELDRVSLHASVSGVEALRALLVEEVGIDLDLLPGIRLLPG